MGGNTVAYYYLDTASFGGDCKNDSEKINKSCKPEADKSEKNKHPALKKMLGAERVAKLEKMAAKMKSTDDKKSAPTDKNAWMENCDGLWLKPNAASAEEFNSMLKDMSDDIGKAIEDQIKPFVEEATKEAIKDKMMGKEPKDVAKKGAKKLLGPLGWVLTGADAVEAALAVKDIKSAIEIAKQAQDELKNMSGKSPTDIMGNGMGVLSRLNPCTRARRCLLVPYKNTKNPASLGGEGCCPGQTGHHVIPRESAADGCDKYNHDEAPTMCVEGANNGNGSHGKAHDELVKIVDKYKEGSIFSGPRENASYGKMRDMGIDSVEKTFPESKCDEKCLRAQLDAYYKDKCKKAMPAAAGKKSPANDSQEDDQED